MFPAPTWNVEGRNAMTSTTTTARQEFEDAMAQWEAKLDHAVATGDVVSLTEGIILAEQEVIRMHEKSTVTHNPCFGAVELADEFEECIRINSSWATGDCDAFESWLEKYERTEQPRPYLKPYAYPEGTRMWLYEAHGLTEEEAQAWIDDANAKYSSVYAESPCGGGAEAIAWFEVGDTIYGLPSWNGWFAIPKSDPMPYVNDYAANEEAEEA